MKNKTVIMGLLGFSALAIIGLFVLIYGNVFSISGNHPLIQLLPLVNALLNGAATVCLCLGLAAILKKRIRCHRFWMLGACLMSSLFLVSYCVYHAVHGDTPFLGYGWIRPVYFFILISHIVLSVVALPCILITVYLSLTDQIAYHKRLARWTWPLWFYVSVTGVLVYALLRFFG
jgi:putative membrane protein